MSRIRGQARGHCEKCDFPDVVGLNGVVAPSEAISPARGVSSRVMRKLPAICPQMESERHGNCASKPGKPKHLTRPSHRHRAGRGRLGRSPASPGRVLTGSLRSVASATGFAALPPANAEDREYATTSLRSETFSPRAGVLRALRPEQKPSALRARFLTIRGSGHSGREIGPLRSARVGTGGPERVRRRGVGHASWGSGRPLIAAGPVLDASVSLDRTPKAAGFFAGLHEPPASL